MIEDEVDKAYRALNGMRNAAHHAVDIGYTLEAKRLQNRFECMAASFTALLLDTLRDVGYDARSYGQGHTHVYVKIRSRPIEIWFYDQPHYIVRFRPSDTQYNLLTALLPMYGKGMHTYSILHVIDALREIYTTIRTHEQCWTCYYSSVGVMGHGNQFYCGAGAVPVAPDCSQYEHYPMESIMGLVTLQ